MSIISPEDKSLLAAIEDGLPVAPDPYAQIARRIGSSEDDVVTRLKRLLKDGVIKRLGLVVRHRELGFKANAMVVWDVPDSTVDQIAEKIAGHSFVTLCYRRERRLPVWPYNLYCMIHGQNRDTVQAQIEQLMDAAGIREYPNAVLFSRRCFKQCGARFSEPKVGAA